MIILTDMIDFNLRVLFTPKSSFDLAHLAVNTLELPYLDSDVSAHSDWMINSTLPTVNLTSGSDK